MAGESEELVGAIQRCQQFRDELRRTADPAERQTIRARLEEATDDLKETVERIKAAAEAGEPEARELIKRLRELSLLRKSA